MATRQASAPGPGRGAVTGRAMIGADAADRLDMHPLDAGDWTLPEDPEPEHRVPGRAATGRAPGDAGKEGRSDAGRLREAVPRRGGRHGLAGAGGASQRPGAWAAGAGPDPGVADQPVRLLPGDAQPGRPGRGEHATRLDTVAAWREAPFFTVREQAALAWCEALTELPSAGASDDVLQRGGGRVRTRRDRGPDVRDRGDQRLEPARGRAGHRGHQPRRTRPPRRAR